MEPWQKKKFKISVLNNMLENLEKNIDSNEKSVSLIEKMRPKNLSDYIGQHNIIGPKTLLYNLLKSNVIPSMILWGPPGCGKASLINVIIQENETIFNEPIALIKLSASTATISDIKKVLTNVKSSKKIIVFMSEIHKFNKLQQDIFLPYIEVNTFILIGTTIENPSSLNSALLSRCRIFMLEKLQVDDLVLILSKAIKLLNGTIILKTDKIKVKNYKFSFSVDEEVIHWLAGICEGDGKMALNGLEMTVQSKSSNTTKNIKIVKLSICDIKNSLTIIQTMNNKKIDNVYHMHSALHHCIIADDDNATLYWLARILETNEDPVYIAKRLIKIASEDIDFDDENALSIADHTMQACQMIGIPECNVFLAQCVIYLARAKKIKGCKK